MITAERTVTTNPVRLDLELIATEPMKTLGLWAVTIRTPSMQVQSYGASLGCAEWAPQGGGAACESRCERKQQTLARRVASLRCSRTRTWQRRAAFD